MLVPFPHRNRRPSRTKTRPRPRRTPRQPLSVERLEDRITPTTMIDLTSLNASGLVDGTNNATSDAGIFLQYSLNEAAGTGVLDPFLRVQNSPREQGYNTDGPIEFDTVGGGDHTEAIQIKDIPLVFVNGVAYREFVLDINEGGNSLLSLEEVQLYLANSGSISSLSTLRSTGTLIYDLDALDDTWIKLDGELSGNGSGRLDMAMLIPDSVFGSDPDAFLYFFTSFGGPEAPAAVNPYSISSGSGFEEWAVGDKRPVLSSIIGYKYSDGNSSGTDNGEPRVNGVTFQLYRDDGDNVFDAGDTLMQTSVSSDVDLDNNGTIEADEVGVYRFGGVTPGNYWVREVVPAGATQTSANPTLLTVTEAQTFIAPALATGAIGEVQVANLAFGNLYAAGAINIDKVTVDGATSGDALTILSGESIKWRYTVTNTGNVALSNVTVTDNQSGVTPVRISGDTNNDNKLDLTETWIYEASGTAITGNYSNIGTASGVATVGGATVSASDASSYFGANPQIDVEKLVSLDGGFTFVDADTATGPTLVSGTSPIFKFVVTNTGNIALTNIVLTDTDFDLNGADPGTSLTIASLAAGLAFETTFTADWEDGQHSNTASVSVDFSDSAGHTVSRSDSDLAHYFGADPQISIVKVTVDGATSGDGLTILSGESIKWRYTVTNTGNVALSNVTVTDNQPGVTPVRISGDSNNDNILDLTETWVYEASGAAITGSYSNIGTASGSFTDSQNSTRTDSASDASSYFGANPQIDVEKLVSLDGGATFVDADTATGPTLVSGTNPIFKFVVTNTGNVALTNIVLSDSDFDLNGAASGSSFTIASLTAGQVFQMTFTAPWEEDQHSNTASVSVNYSDSAGHTVSRSDSDLAHYFGAELEINIDKVTNGQDGLTIPAGTPITWTYTVTNTGNVALSNVSVTDSDAGVTPVRISGDTNNDNILDLTETWVYEASGTAITGSYSNTGTASGSFTDSQNSTRTDTATDDSSYFGSNTQISIVKVTVDGATSGDGLTILSGESIKWRYTVTNTGNVALSDVSVTDNQPGVTPVRISGDSNNDNILDLTETWVYEASGAAITGSYSNTGTVSGSFTDSQNTTQTVSASDASSYFGANPQIDVEKLVSLDGGATFVDADTATGPTLVSGTSPIFKFVVTNTGNVALTNIVLSDSDFDLNGADPGTSLTIASLAAGLAFETTFTADWEEGQHSNTASVSVNYSDSAGHTVSRSDSDLAHYFGADLEINIDKVTNGQDGLIILAGTPITWTYTVTNTGNVALSDVSVTDSDAGVTPVRISGDSNNDNILDLTETWIYEASGTATVGDYANTGTASGSFTDSQNTTRTDSASDDSSYFGADPQISIDKTTNGDDGKTVVAGTTVVWTYRVTNTGNVPLADIVVTDSDAAVVPEYVSGDENDNDLLDLDETWLFRATGEAIEGEYENTGTATAIFVDDIEQTAQVEAFDESSYTGIVPVVTPFVVPPELPPVLPSDPGTTPELTSASIAINVPVEEDLTDFIPPQPPPVGPAQPLFNAPSPPESNTLSLSGSGVDLGTISGVVYLDDNGNGLPDAGEEGLANQLVLLEAHTADGAAVVLGAVTSNDKGEYAFINLPQGTYKVRVQLEGKYRQSNTADSVGAYLVPIQGNLHARRRDFGAVVPVGGSRLTPPEGQAVPVVAEAEAEANEEARARDEVFLELGAPEEEETPTEMRMVEDLVREDAEGWSMALAAMMTTGAGVGLLSLNRRRSAVELV